MRHRFVATINCRRPGETQASPTRGQNRFGAKQTSETVAGVHPFRPVCPDFGFRFPPTVGPRAGNRLARVALGRLGEASYNRDVCFLTAFAIAPVPRSAIGISLLQNCKA